MICKKVGFIINHPRFGGFFSFPDCYNPNCPNSQHIAGPVGPASGSTCGVASTASPEPGGSGAGGAGGGGGGAFGGSQKKERNVGNPTDISNKYEYIYIYIHTLWLFNIAMENGPFIDGLPVKDGDFPWLC